MAPCRDPWDAHYSRVIENQLDVPHVPFIHHNTIGRGVDARWSTARGSSGWTRIASCRPYACAAGRRHAAAPSRRDAPAGQGVLARVHLPQPVAEPHQRRRRGWSSPSCPWTTRTPCCTCASTRTSCACPCCATSSTGCRCRSTPSSRTRTAGWCETQLPKRSDLQMGEKLIQGDGPIIAYRRRRQELIDTASGKTAKIA